MTHPLEAFDRIRIINLVDRVDRRVEMHREIERIGGFDNGRICFHEVRRPTHAGSFPSIGARGCYLSHLDVLREARDAGARSLLILEDDFDFARDFRQIAAVQLRPVRSRGWGLFYGSYRTARGAPALRPHVPVPPTVALGTTVCVAIEGAAIPRLIQFLEGCLTRPAGSPHFGPMHVDAAHIIFRRINPDVATFVACPQLGGQRSSPSDITPRSPAMSALAAIRDLAFTRGRRLVA